jgi:hypothetical protein
LAALVVRVVVLLAPLGLDLLLLVWRMHGRYRRSMTTTTMTMTMIDHLRLPEHKSITPGGIVLIILIADRPLDTLDIVTLRARRNLVNSPLFLPTLPRTTHQSRLAQWILALLQYHTSMGWEPFLWQTTTTTAISVAVL